MQTFSQEIREQLYKANRGYCSIPGCTNKAKECHHILHNTLVNQKKFPLFLQSPFNCAILCRDCHMKYSTFSWLKITEKQAEVYESYLKGLKNAE
ncbi:MAG: hypothetical protein WC516_06105 [Patescibacteria group bacterium]|jgi:hypothetical protein